MVEETAQKTATGPFGWMQDEIYQLKGQVAQLTQQLEQLRSMATEQSESQRAVETSLRETALGAAQTPRLQEELNQAAALIVQLQDQQAETKERLEQMGRRSEEEESHDQEDWVEVARRVEQVERQVDLWHDRQAAVDEVARRFQEGLSLVRQQLQQADQRLEAAESKAARGLEEAGRAEHTLTQVQATLTALEREDEAIAERGRVTAEVAHRAETALNERPQELQRLELLAERIELHRAERQRLEDRTVRLEEELGELRGRTDQGEQRQVVLSSQQQGLASRLDSLQEGVTDQRAMQADLLRKLLDAQARTKRRQVQELEREIREMKQYVAGLTDE
jgi:chromosome segregation ATPase